MNYRAIIFDMDGTIVNTEHLWHQATTQVITNRGYQLNFAEKEMIKDALAGIGLPKGCQFIKEFLKTDDSIEILMKEKSAIACQLYESGIRFIDGFPEFHKKVIDIPLAVGVATNANIETMALTNKALNLSNYFGQHLYTINHVDNRGKPHPAIYLYAARQLGIAPHQCIAIEDSAHGIIAAKAAGMFCIGINTSRRPEQIKDAHLQVEHYENIDLEYLLQS
jgi:beta-phosphoglucomutase